MGNENGRGKPRIDPALEKKLDPSTTRLDLKNKNVYSVHFTLVDCSLYTNVTWINLPNNFLDKFPPLHDTPSLKTIRLSANRISDLPDITSKLVNLTSLDLAKNDFQILGDAFGLLTSLVDLNCHWNNIVQMSPQFSRLEKLKILNISLNKLTNFPSMPNSSKLENIDLSHNRLTDIPQCFSSFGALHTLNHAGNQIKYIQNVEVFAGFKSLVTLDLQNNELKTLPKECSNMVALKYLRLRANLIEVLPECINSLTNLEELEASQNYLTHLSPGLGALTKLQNLFLYQNQIREIPEELGNLRQVKEYGIAFNNLGCVPPSFCGLAECVVFMASNNHLDSLPSKMFSGLIAVQDLFLNHNAICSVPDSITNLINLQKLEMTQNKLEDFPNISNLTTLQALELGCNAFKRFPLGVLCCSLQVLNLFGNGLTVIPSEIGQLTNLKKLFLSYNQLVDLPSSFSALTQLRDLYLAGNQFKILPSPIFTLESLVQLSVNNNQISDIPQQIGNLTALESLNLNNNKLSKLHAAVGKCTALKDFDLSHNFFLDFPEEISKLKNLVDLDLSGNNITNIPTAFEEECAGVHQVKLSYNNIPRVPNFKSYQKTGLEESTVSVHVPWVSCTGNPLLHGWYDPKADLKKLRAKYETETKKTLKRGFKLEDFQEERSGEDDPSDLERSLGTPSPGDSSPGLGAKPSFDSLRTTSDGLASHGKKASYLNVKKARGGFKSGLMKKIDRSNYRNTVGWSEIRGRRQDQQDTICIDLAFRGSPNRTVLCCFDGHSGPLSSELVSRKILPILSSKFDDVDGVDPSILNAFSKNELLFPAHVPTTTNDNQKRSHMVDPDAIMTDFPITKKTSKGRTPRKKFPDKKEQLQEAEYIWIMNSTFEDLHRKITKNRFTDGSAALVVVIEHDHKRLIVANSGDQRAVLARGDCAVPITTDHKPDEPTEKLRIYHVGGFVNEQKRVDGILTLSRSLGDNYLQPHVTFRPDVDFVDLQPNDKFLIVACDGLWDMVSNEEAVALIANISCPCAAAALLVDYAHGLGSGDNVSAIVYHFNTNSIGEASGASPASARYHQTPRLSTDQSSPLGISFAVPSLSHSDAIGSGDKDPPLPSGSDPDTSTTPNETLVIPFMHTSDPSSATTPSVSQSGADIVIISTPEKSTTKRKYDRKKSSDKKSSSLSQPNDVENHEHPQTPPISHRETKKLERRKTIDKKSSGIK